MLEKLRSTLIYKIYGYLSFFYLILIFIFILYIIGWIPYFLTGIMPIFIILLLLLILFLFILPIIFFAVFFITKNSNIVSNINIWADIGNIINVTFFIIIIFLFTLTYIEMDNKYNDDNYQLKVTNEYLIKAQNEIKQKGLNNDTKLLLADGYRLAGQHEIAIEMYNNLTKDNSSAYIGLALTYLREKKYEEVIKYIDLFIENPQTYKFGTEQQQRMMYQLIYKEKAKAHWKLHQYIKWAKVYKKTLYQYAIP